MNRKGSVTIQKELCKGCRYCVTACPKGVLESEEAPNTHGYFAAVAAAPGLCNGCALCARMCPEVCIEVWQEEE